MVGVNNQCNYRTDFEFCVKNKYDVLNVIRTIANLKISIVITLMKVTIKFMIILR